MVGDSLPPRPRPTRQLMGFYARAVDVVALRLEDEVLEWMTCTEVIANFDAGLCTIEEVSGLDPDGDGVPTCP